MRKDFQIRIEAVDGEEAVHNYSTRAAASSAYNHMLARYRENYPSEYYEFELIEVLQQDTLKVPRPDMSLLQKEVAR